MREKQILERAFAMPLTSPPIPAGTVPVRQPRIPDHHLPHRSGEASSGGARAARTRRREALVKYEFIRMPDSNGFGDYTESGQVIPVSFRGRKGGYTHCMFLNDEGPIAGGRELWGFPKKLANRRCGLKSTRWSVPWITDRIRVATGTMGYKHSEANLSHSELRLRRRTSCSRSFRMSTARHASANLSNIISRMSRQGRVDRACGVASVASCVGTRSRPASSRGGVRDSYSWPT